MKISSKLDVITEEINDLKEIASRTQAMVSDILYKEGITKIDAAFETLMDGANNLEETLK